MKKPNPTTTTTLPLLLPTLLLATHLTQTNPNAQTPPGPQPQTPQNGKPPGNYPNYTVTAANWTMDATQATNLNNYLKHNITMNLNGEGPLPWSLTGFGHGYYAPRLNVADPQAAQTNHNQLPYDITIDGDDYQWQNDKNPWHPAAAAWRPHPAKGILLATTTKNTQQWNDNTPPFHALTSITITHSDAEGYNMLDGTFGPGDTHINIHKAGQQSLAAINTATAWFPYDQGWIGGHVKNAQFLQAEWIQDPFHHPNLPDDPANLITWTDQRSGFPIPPANLTLPNINAHTDGMLFTIPILDQQPHNPTQPPARTTAVNPQPDGTGWQINIRSDQETDPTKTAQTHNAFAFLYIPYTANNLIAGHIRGADANVLNGRGQYTIQRTTTGRWQLTIPQKKPTDGMLILTPVGTDRQNNITTTYLTYQPNPNNTHTIEARRHQTPTNQPLTDTDFYFAWIDFANPPTPPHWQTNIDPPTITHQPQPATIPLGENTTFTVTATGQPPLLYQWHHNNTPIPNATHHTLTLTQPTPQQAGQYTVQITNPGGKTTSQPTTLTILTPPQITTQPQPITAPLGATITFTITATGTPPLQYQWQKNGADIPNATQPTLTLTNLTTNHAGQYRIHITNQLDQTYSQTARLTIQPQTQPTLTITQQPQNQTIQTHQTLTLTATHTGGAPPYTYQWHHNNNPIPNATQPTLTIPNANQTHNGNYHLTITDATGQQTTTQTATIIITPPPTTTPLTITQQPQNQTIRPGQTATLTITHTGGTPPYTYQWQQNDFNIPAANNQTFTIPNAQPTDQGNYRITITDATGQQTTSQPATLTITTNPQITQQPQNQTVIQGNSVAFTIQAQGTPPLTYQWQLNGTNIPGARDPQFIIPQVQPINAGKYQVLITDTNGQTLSQPATLTVIPDPNQPQPPNPNPEPDPNPEPQPQPAPTIHNVTLNGNTLHIQWQTRPRLILQITDNLTNPNWQDIPTTQNQNQTQQLTLSHTAYYRLIQR